MSVPLPHHAYGHDPKSRYRGWLASLARDASRTVEVGVWTGRTTRRMARATRGTVWAVDHWTDLTDCPVQAPIYAQFHGNERKFRRRLRPWIASGRVVVVKLPSVEAAALLLEDYGRTFDLVFIDADHRYEAVRQDIQAWRPLVRPGGILSGHDYNWPDVARAVGELIPEHHTAAGGFCWWTEVGG